MSSGARACSHVFLGQQHQRQGVYETWDPAEPHRAETAERISITCGTASRAVGGSNTESQIERRAGSWCKSCTESTLASMIPFKSRTSPSQPSGKIQEKDNSRDAVRLEDLFHDISAPPLALYSIARRLVSLLDSNVEVPGPVMPCLTSATRRGPKTAPISRKYCHH